MVWYMAKTEQRPSGGYMYDLAEFGKRRSKNGTIIQISKSVYL